MVKEKMVKKNLANKKQQRTDYSKVTLKDLKKALKTEDSIFSNCFYRIFSLRMTRYLIRTNITPNQVTFISLVIGIVPFFLFMYGDYWLNIWAVIFIHLAFLIDHIDGEIARFKKIGSKFGAWFDQVTDRIKEFVIFGGIAIGLYTRTGDPIMLIFGMASITNLLMVGYVRSTAWFLNLKKTSDIKIGKRTHLGFIDTIFFMITIAAIFDVLELILIFFATFGALIWLYQLLVRYLYVRKHPV